METGPLFLMPFSKKNIQDQELSIQIFKDGFSFCTSNTRSFFNFNNLRIEQGDNFQRLLESHSFLGYKKIKGIHFNTSATFVPSSLYSPVQKETYLHYNVALEERWSIVENQTQDDQIKILYAVDGQIEATLKHYFKGISFTHYAQILYDLSSSLTNFEDSVVMNIHMLDDQFDVLVFKDEQLLLYNTYPYKNEPGFLYFVLAVAEELSLPPEAYTIVFFGKFSRYKKYYTALANYHEKIKFSDQNELVTFDEKEHPAPYFLNLYQ
jgi:hypothetical protein